MGRFFSCLCPVSFVVDWFLQVSLSLFHLYFLFRLLFMKEYICFVYPYFSSYLFFFSSCFYSWTRSFHSSHTHIYIRDFQTLGETAQYQLNRDLRL
ncbi:hypothetical protein V8F33_013022 [Rhypophila sp. PSN 637]